MKHFKNTVIATFVVLVLLPSVSNAESDINRVARQYREYCLQESTDRGQRLLNDVELPTTSVEDAMRLARSLDASGAWPDINYVGRARSAWEPGDHLTRILSMIVMARRFDTPVADAEVCIAAVHRALAFWIPRDPMCPNWWYNEIGSPKILGNVALLLGTDLRTEELEYIGNTVLARSRIGTMTGQNRVWLAGNGVMRALLIGDAALLGQAVAVIQDEIKVSGNDEGIQPDWSFHQHGPQQQFGNYGMAFAVEMSRWASVLRGTRYAIAPLKMGMIRSYFQQGLAWVTWRDMLDISACGRQLFPNSQQKKAGVIRAAMRSMAAADPDGVKDYTAFISRTAAPDAANDLLGDHVFWRSDYVIHRRPDFMVTLKMSSSRVIGGETVNSENLSGARLADGAMYVYRSGHEYENIFPVWDWRKIPGTTSAQDNAPLGWPGKIARDKAPSFVGAVSDGNDACAAMDLRRGELRAKKSWFFFGDTVVCLGAAITSADTAPVLTIVNQCELAGPITARVHGQITVVRDSQTKLTDAEWIEHAGTRYLFPVPEPVTITSQSRTGNWHDVFNNPSSPKADVTENVFTLCIDHGSAPRDGSYAYYVVPAGRAEQSPSRILINSDTVQAVQMNSHVTAAVFWTAGGIDLDGVPISVDQPCLLLLESAGGKNLVTVSDPTEKLKQLSVTISGSAKTVDLPRAGDAGKSVTIQ